LPDNTLETSGVPAFPQPETPTTTKTRSGTWLTLALAAIALLGGVFYLWSRSRSSPPVVSASDRSIAILPFQSLAPAPQDEYLGIGMTDALITRLSNLHKIVVRPVGAVRKYATEEDPLAAGRQLAVQSVLEGSIQRSADRTRVTVRLLRVSDGELLWGSTFDEKFTDMFSVEDSISQQVASALMINLSGADQTRLTRPFTASNQAYQLYMKGRYFWNKRTVDGMKKSLDYFQQAIATDPNYALAYAGLADAYTAAGSYGYSILTPHEAMPKAEAAAKKALAIDDTLAEAHASLAYIQFIYDWHWAGAEQEFKRAIALNPSYDTAHHWYSHELMAMGREDEAMDEARRALELSPSDVVMNEHMGWIYMMKRDYPHAVQTARKALELDPNFLLAHRVLAQAYLYQGQYPEAIEEFQRGVDLSHGDPVSKAYLARAYAVAGRKEDALTVLQELRQLAATHYVPPAEVAQIYAGLGQNPEAFASLSQAFEERETALVYLKVDRGYDPLRNDPSFAALLKRLNL
jgi:TolB-like protein/Tfp pilus assembly protein PilF